MKIEIMGLVKTTATMNLRWVNSDKADKETNAVNFTNNVGWGWPEAVVLQQMFIEEDAKGRRQIWKDVEVITES